MNCEVHSIYWGIIERCDGCLAVSVHTHAGKRENGVLCLY